MRRKIITAVVIAFLSLCFPVTPAHSVVPSLIPNPNPCPMFPAPDDPCLLAVLPFVGVFAGGEQAGIYLINWWNTQFLPTLRQMTGQLYAARVDQSRQIGSLIDAQSVNRVAHLEQELQLRSQKNNLPSEMVCVAGSYSAALSQTMRISGALTKGFKMDLMARAEGAIGSSSERGVGADQYLRWARYCTEFHDPLNNNGIGIAPNCLAHPLSPGAVPNGDIDIEGFLLKDTINMSSPDEYATSVAMLQNLVQPTIREKIPNNAINTPTGHEAIIMMQHLEAVTNVSAHTVAEILSRRAGIPAAFALPPLLRDIRIKAGVDPTQVSNNPSYNEIMLAMTKERFLNPEYFVRIHEDIGAIKQEQASVNAYINLQMQDIYRMQEQINLLLAARASLKFDSDPKTTNLSGAPL
ncbi:MAG: hypothetical protein KAI76_10120 [Alphaproteobacteria bacterium]|nr:hypothetical protein [Alphaproteobacteria bacterium]